MQDIEVVEVKSKATTPEDKSWLAYFWQSQQEAPNRLEDAAKFLATMISVSLSLFLALGKNGIGNSGLPAVKFAVVLWLLSLLLAFCVLWPFRYKLVRDSASDIRRAFRQTVIVKRVLLILSLVCFFSALFILGLPFIFP